MLEAFARDFRAGTRDGLIRAARRAYLVALLALTVPGALLGGLLWLSGPALTPWPAVAGLLVLGLVLAAGTLYLAHQAARRPDLPARQAALTGSMQAATAPGVLLLLGCTMLAQPPALAAFWVLALAVHALVWSRLPGWVRTPETREEGLPPG